ncbi:MAG: MBL fold metallo-hydrolase [Bacteroidales bacterium]
MRITVLGSGTSTGVPEIGCTCDVCSSADSRDNRMRASVLVENGHDRILIDCGPDFRTQMLTFRPVSPNALLLTHLHYDHVSGIDDLRPFCRHQAFRVFAERRAAEGLREKYSYMFQDHKYPGIPDIDLITIHRTPFIVGNTPVIPIRLFHYKLPVLGFRIGDMAYLTDFTVLPDTEMSKLAGVKLVIMDALRKTRHLSHLSLDEAIKLSQSINAPMTYFTHMSHQMGLHHNVESTLPEGFHLAYDGLQLYL